MYHPLRRPYLDGEEAVRRLNGGGEKLYKEVLRERRGIRWKGDWIVRFKLFEGSLCSSWKSGHGGRGDILWVWDCSRIGWEDLIVSVNCLTIHSISISVTGEEPPFKTINCVPSISLMYIIVSQLNFTVDFIKIHHCWIYFVCN